MSAVNQQQSEPTGAALIPQVVASYAAYLRTRTGTAPEITLSGDHAEASLTIGDRTLVLALSRRSREWSLNSAVIKRAAQTAAFGRGELAAAVATLLQPSDPPLNASRAPDRNHP